MMEDKWISVNDSLPELEETVLLFDHWRSSDGKEYKDIRTGYLAEVVIRKTSDGIRQYPEWRSEYAFNITHWQPLPPQPKTTTP